MTRLGVTGLLLLWSVIACQNPGNQSTLCTLQVEVGPYQPLAFADGGYQYDFGSVSLDAGASFDLQLNENCGPVRILSAMLDGGPGFIFPAPGGGVAFDPAVYGSFQAVLTLTTDSQVQPVVSIDLTGNAPAPGPVCSSDADCASGTFCEGGYCRSGCAGFSNLPEGADGGRSCAPQSTACAGDAGWLLVDTLGDSQNCGGCGKACPASQGCGGGKCGSCAGYRIGTEQDLPVALGQPDAGLSLTVSDVAVGDLDGDGLPDLLLTVEVDTSVGTPAQTSSVLMFMNDGRGGFGAMPRTSGACGPTLALGDFNGDCKLDVASAGAILLNDGRGFFPLRNSATTTVTSAASQLTVMDLNGDGIADLAYGQEGPVVLLGDGKGSFPPQAEFYGAMDLKSFAVADFDQDGRPDVAGFGLISTFPQTPIAAFQNQSGYLEIVESYEDQGGSLLTPNPSSFAAGRLAGSGAPALVYGENGNVIVLPAPLSGPSGASMLGLDGGFGSLAVADLDLDGRADVVGSESFSDGGVLDLWTKFASVGGALQPGSLQTVATSAPAAFVKVADLNGDGVPDIVAVSSGSPQPIIMLFLGSCE